MKNGTVTGKKFLTFVEVSWPLRHQVDVHCTNKNVFRGRACTYTRSFANIDIQTTKLPISL